MLKKWTDPSSEVCTLVEETIDEVEKECLPLWGGGTQQGLSQEEVNLNSQLSEVQKDHFRVLLQEFTEVVSNKISQEEHSLQLILSRQELCALLVYHLTGFLLPTKTRFRERWSKC